MQGASSVMVPVSQLSFPVLPSGSLFILHISASPPVLRKQEEDSTSTRSQVGGRGRGAVWRAGLTLQCRPSSPRGPHGGPRKGTFQARPVSKGATLPMPAARCSPPRGLSIQRSKQRRSPGRGLVTGLPPLGADGGNPKRLPRIPAAQPCQLRPGPGGPVSTATTTRGGAVSEFTSQETPSPAVSPGGAERGVSHGPPRLLRAEAAVSTTAEVSPVASNPAPASTQPTKLTPHPASCTQR